MILQTKTTKNNEKWPHIPDHPYIILTIGGSGSGKTITYIDKIYLYAKDLSKPRYEFLIKKLKDVRTNHFNDANTFIECSNAMDDDYENIGYYNPRRKRKVLIVFDDMIADIMTNKKFQAIIKELFIRCRRLNISLVFITQSYFSVPKDARLNSTHYLINKRKELKNIAINDSADIDYKDFYRFTENIQENHILF